MPAILEDIATGGLGGVQKVLQHPLWSQVTLPHIDTLSIGPDSGPL